MIIDIIAGARPNFMKVAALFAIAEDFPQITLRLIHTGQHYDENMSDVFFQELDLPKPLYHLGVGSGGHTAQTSKIMIEYDAWIRANPPDWVVVVGDVNSTLACTLVATKHLIPVAHVEAGLRSFDRKMPEEINRVITDSVSSLLFVTESSGVINLAREGHDTSKIHLVGHVMIDTLLRQYNIAENLKYYEKFGLQKNKYAFLTLHRPANVDHKQQFLDILEQIEWVSSQIPILFAIHPRTQQRLHSFDLENQLKNIANIHVTNPLSYRESLSIMGSARIVLTDSGGIQEETSALNVPCFTLRDSTERPITISEGTNTLVNYDWELFRNHISSLLTSDQSEQKKQIPYWDGKAGQRILKIISQQS